jgi:hypothetical protein
MRPGRARSSLVTHKMAIAPTASPRQRNCRAETQDHHRNRKPRKSCERTGCAAQTIATEVCSNLAVAVSANVADSVFDEHTVLRPRPS